MKHNFEETRQHRLDAAKDGIERNEAAAEKHFGTADAIAKYIPPGQPILVGHHSEKRHRKDIERMHGSMSKGRTALEKADYYRDRVAAMETSTIISSDDPEAIPKLSEKLEKLIEMQEFMKAANKCIKKKDKDAFLKLNFGTEQLWTTLNTPDCCRRIGFPQYKLTNNNAKIRLTRQRLELMYITAGQVTTEKTIHGIRVIQNVDANRIQLLFPSKPSEEVRDKLFYTFHFRWCRQEAAWQRFLNPQGIYEAEAFLIWYGQTINE
jgi:hypothetical protein